MVSILGNQDFNFPKKMQLDYVLKDILENNVDEKYYIDEEKAKTILNQLKNKDTVLIDMVQARREGHPRKYKDIAPTLNARDYKEPRLIQVGELDIKGQDIVKRVYDPNGLAPTLTTMQGGNRQPKIIVNKPICLNSKGGRNGKQGIQPSLQDRVYSDKAISVALTTGFLPSYSATRGIRKITPKERFKLMGVPVRISNKTTVSNSQQYKQTGNSIVTTVLMAIFGELLGLDWQTKVKELVEEIVVANNDFVKVS